MLPSTALAAGVTSASLLAGCAAATSPAKSSSPSLRAKTELVLLGTAGGAPVRTRFGIASALVVNGNVYLVDCGRGALSQYMRAGLDPSRLRGIFLTHLHVDHVADYFGFATLVAAYMQLATGKMPLFDVYGPGPAGALPTPSHHGTRWVAPDHPTPGLADLTRLSDAAFGYSSNAFIAEGLGTDPATALRVHEIDIPNVGASPIGDTAPAMRPFKVMSNDDITVSATLVPHGAVFPAFAYRFETADGVVAFSGDTALAPNIPTLAHGADILVHEAVDLQY
ncbi:MBL fold metallo-hydrolase [Streptomyces sp. NPDC054783]